MYATRGDTPANRGSIWFLLSGIFLASLSLLAFEITLTRLLSVMLLYHYVFAVVSLALLGLGAGGIFVYFFRRQVPDDSSRFTTLAVLASQISLTIIASVMLMALISTIASLRDIVAIYFFLFFIPFFFAGILLAEAFRMFPLLSPRLYGADLVGAALGSLGVIVLLDAFGGIGTSFLLAVMASAAALVFVLPVLKEKLKHATLPLVSFATAAILFVMSFTGLFLPDIPEIGNNPLKDIYKALHGAAPGTVVETRWSAFGRTDVVAFPGHTEFMNIYIDGTAGSTMYQFTGNLLELNPDIEQLKTHFSGYFPLLFLTEEQKNNALIIGPGGGRDVLMMLMAGIGTITAVEVNRDIVDIVQDYSHYNGGIYTDFDNVTVIVDEGRNFLKRQKEKYDLIMLSLPVTQTSRSLEGYALTENFIFTTNSINDYLDRLTDEGQLIVVTQNDFRMLKLISTSLSAFHERGISTGAALNQIYMLGLSSPTSYPLFVMKKTPFTSEQIAAKHETMRQLGYNPLFSYFPYTHDAGMVNPLLLALSTNRISLPTLEKQQARDHSIDISPVTDNRPFFYKIDVGLPQPVMLVSWFSAIALCLVIAVPMSYLIRHRSRRETRHKTKARSPLLPLRSIVLFAMLGMGFMLVEISLIQKFIMFLGQPVISVALLLFSLLVGAGLGSLFSERLSSSQLTRWLAVVALMIAIGVFSYSLLLPLIFNQLLGLSLTSRLLTTIVIVVPLGFLMGFPFPIGIRRLKEIGAGNTIPWMWGINGVSSVLGSVLTIVLAINFGFMQALIAGAVCYFLVSLTFWK